MSHMPNDEYAEAAIRQGDTKDVTHVYDDHYGHYKAPVKPASSGKPPETIPHPFKLGGK